ncbi:hypothetical protein RJT34_32784 [Clitoria ternatea]|uniref:SAM domain-containing protein n=1 Tax=Clitoria ternatea TaxID=43366 RepID=A0AAN9EZ45_CLITE
MDWFSWLSRTSLEPSLIYDYGLTFARNELQLEDASYFNHEFLQSMGISIAKHRLEILKLVKRQQESSVAAPPKNPGSKNLSGVIKRCLRKCMSKLVSHDHHHHHHHHVKDMHMPMPVSLSLPPHEPNWYNQGKWKGAVVKKQGSEDLKEEKAMPMPPMYRSRTIALSGPLDGRMHEKMINNKALKLSGPLDGRMHERMMNMNRSPLLSRPTMDGRFLASTRSPRASGPIDPRMMVESRSPILPRPFDPTRAETESPMGFSPYNKPKAEFDYDDDHTLWTALFQDLKPT